jgi:hypothetical protein
LETLNLTDGISNRKIANAIAKIKSKKITNEKVFELIVELAKFVLLINGTRIKSRDKAIGKIIYLNDL